MWIILSIILLGLMAFVGGDRGIKSFITLVLNIAFIGISIYAMLLGINPLIVLVIDIIIFTQITLLYQNGHSLKTYSAVISVIIVTVVLGIGLFSIINSSKIYGYSELELTSDLVTYFSPNITINMAEIMIVTVIIGLLGAIMDTAMAITSAIYEFYRIDNNLSIKQLMKSGFNVGKDILGTTVNTIFFASLGDALMVMILFVNFNYTLQNLINSKEFVRTLIMMVVAALGCIIVIPISIAVIIYMLKEDSRIIRLIKLRIEKKNLELGGNEQ